MDDLRAFLNSTAALGRLNLSLTPEQQRELLEGLGLVQKLATERAVEKAIQAVCPLCELAANTGQVGAASQNGDGVTFWHQVGIARFRKCLADPIRQLSW